MRSMKRFLAAASALTMALSISGTGIFAAEPAVTTAKPAVTTTAKTTVKTVSTTAAKTTAAPAATTIPTATKPAETTVSTKRYISHNAMDIKEDYPAYMAKLAEMPEKEKMIKLFSDVIKLSSLNMRQEAYITNVYDGGTVRGENGDPEITPNNGRFYYDFGMNEIFMAEAEDGADRLLQQQRVYYNYYSMKYDLLKKQTVTKDEINAFLKKNFPKAECLSVTEYEARELIGFEGTRPKYSDKTIKTTPYMFINYKKGITRSELLDIEDYLKANKFDTKVLSFKDGLIRLESFRNGEYTLTHSEALDMAYGLYKKYGIFPTANVYRLGRMYEETAGDYDGDGNVSIRDAAAIARAVAAGTKLPKNSDFNNDGYTNIRDAAAMARFLAVTAKSSGSLETPEQIRTFLKHFIDSYAMDANIIVNSDNTKAIVGCKAEDKDSSDFIKMIMSVCRIDAGKVQFVNT